MIKRIKRYLAFKAKSYVLNKMMGQFNKYGLNQIYYNDIEPYLVLKDRDGNIMFEIGRRPV